MIPLGMGIDYTTEDYAQRLAPGFTFLSGQEPPYLVHCTEGKDRAGFASMLRSIAGLEKGASLEGVDLAAAAENYLLNAGVTAEDIAALKGKLGGTLPE